MTEAMWADLFKTVASTGIVGVFLVIALLALKDKDKKLNDEKDARIKDSAQYLALAMSLQEKVISAVKSLAEIVEKWEKREEERERLEREIAARTKATPYRGRVMPHDDEEPPPSEPPRVRSKP